MIKARQKGVMERAGRITLRLEPLEGRVLLSGASGYALQTLGSFNGTNGQWPTAGLVMDGSSNLYGTTFSGGANGDGAVFEVAAGSNTITTLASFNGTNGANPYAGLIMDGSGNLYGTAYSGGANGDGTVFEVAAGSNAITTLASFDGTNGANPIAGLIMDGSGNLYGTTYYGGANSHGTVFEMAAGSNTITTLASFSGANGAGPYGGLIMDGSGNLYGTTAYGGAGQVGAVFEVAAGSNTITALASFDGTNGANPIAGLIMDGSGNLYGTTVGGGANSDGTVFEVAAGSNTITTLASFNGTNGNSPYAGLIMDGSGNLYGTTYKGGAHGDGTAFEVAAGSNTITTLASFNGTNGGWPWGGLIMDGSGNLYGTTAYGSAANDGTVFELCPVRSVGPAITSPDGHVQVSVYDVAGALDVSISDIKVTWGTGDSISSITLGGTQPMDGLGIVISKASSVGSISVGSIKDARTGVLGDVAFIASAAPIKSIQLKSGMTGYNINGLTLGALSLPGDIDGDGDITDATAIYSTGAVGKVTLTGNATGDIWIGGKDSKGLALSSFSNKTGGYHGDLVAAGNVGKMALGGTYAGQMRISGSLSGLQIKGGNLAGSVLVQSVAGKLSVAAMTNKQTGLTTGGDITSGAHIYAGVSLSGLSVSGSLIGGSTDDADLVQIFSPLIGSVSVGGNITDSRILAGAVLGADWALGGTGNDADSFAAGTISKISVKGNVSDSLIGAGVSPHNGVFDLQWLHDNKAFIAGSVIGSGSIGGSLTSSWGRVGAAYGVGAATVGSGKIGGTGLDLVFSNAS